MSRRTVIFLAGCFFLIAAEAQEAISYEQLSDHEMLNNAAPHFKAKTLNDIEFELSGLNGKIVILHFWSLSCAACFKELPDLNMLASKYSHKGVVLISLMDNDREKLLQKISLKSDSTYALKKAVFGNYNIDFQIIPNALSIMKTYTQQTSYPQTFFIDSNGVIKDYASGYIGSDNAIPNAIKNYGHLEEKVLKLLARQ